MADGHIAGRVVSLPRDLDDPSALRPQYHFRDVGGHMHIWHVPNLLKIAQGAPIRDHPVSEITEVDHQHWGPSPMTPRDVLTHAKLIAAADLRYPILLCEDDRLIDGMHRVLRALQIGQAALPARVITLPAPDHIDVNAKDLPYA